MTPYDGQYCANISQMPLQHICHWHRYVPWIVIEAKLLSRIVSVFWGLSSHVVSCRLMWSHIIVVRCSNLSQGSHWAHPATKSGHHMLSPHDGFKNMALRWRCLCPACALLVPCLCPACALLVPCLCPACGLFRRFLGNVFFPSWIWRCSHGFRRYSSSKPSQCVNCICDFCCCFQFFVNRLSLWFWNFMYHCCIMMYSITSHLTLIWFCRKKRAVLRLDQYKDQNVSLAAWCWMRLWWRT